MQIIPSKTTSLGLQLKDMLRVLVLITLTPFFLAVRLDTIRLLIVIAIQKGWKVFQLDVKSEFLNGVL
jgi:hypothetical protein